MDEFDLERVLKSAGRRERPPAEIASAVRASLHAEWRATVAERGRRRNRWMALAASLVAGILAVWAIAPRLGEPAGAVATVALAVGDVRATAGWLDPWNGLDDGEPLLSGQTLETDADARVALAFPGGVSVRLDRGSRLVATSADRLVLERGSLFVDAGPEPGPDSRLDVVTREGTVRHVGTRYEVRLLDTGTRVRVRDGVVEWDSGDGSVEHSRAGEQITVGSDGRIERAAVNIYGPDWAWTGEVAPAPSIEGMPLGRFLAWAARETGRELAYDSSQTEMEAAAIVLHGSIQGLAPEQALHAVVGTTRLGAAVEGGRIVVSGR